MVIILYFGQKDELIDMQRDILNAIMALTGETKKYYKGTIEESFSTYY